jgi:hypothetical protein
VCSGKEEGEGGNADTSGSGKEGDKGRGKGGERNMELIEFNFRLHLYKAKVRLLQVRPPSSQFLRPSDAMALVDLAISMRADACS